MPNSNSMTMPVATPMAKVSANTFVQKRAIWWYSGFFVASHSPSMITSSTPSPMLSGGKR